jgi:shikimate kinase
MAERWGCPWVDTDDLIAEEVGRPSAQYLREAGEPAFRDQELVALEQALESDAVVATGGGVVTSPRARELLGQSLTLWLDCEDDVILTRVLEGDRPLLGDEPRASLIRLRQEREGWYNSVSRARVEASGTLEDVSERLIRAMSEADQ